MWDRRMGGRSTNMSKKLSAPYGEIDFGEGWRGGCQGLNLPTGQPTSEIWLSNTKIQLPSIVTILLIMINGWTGCPLGN